jgi:epoxide hydrolase-like predicted phosphatase
VVGKSVVGVDSEHSREIEFVYFDLGNVLLSFDPAAACANLSKNFDITIHQARAAVYESRLQDRFEHGEVTGQQFADAIRQQLGRAESAMPTELVLDAVSDMFTPIDSMRDVMQRVRESGCRVGLLSNTCHAHWDWIGRQKYAVMDFVFEATILSFEVGSMKPDHRIYEAAEQAAQVPPKRILFLDDKDENVAAAIDRGWNAAQCLGGEASVRRLQAFGLIGGTR